MTTFTFIRQRRKKREETDLLIQCRLLISKENLLKKEKKREGRSKQVYLCIHSRSIVVIMRKER
jgi:hypothetical protein